MVVSEKTSFFELKSHYASTSANIELTEHKQRQVLYRKCMFYFYIPLHFPI